MLETKKLTKHFEARNEFEVLNDISISAKDGEFVCIVGPSGCGKSILLYLLAGFLQPTDGEILIDGNKVESPDLGRVMIFQDYVLFPWKTVFENILFALEHVDLTIEAKHALVEKYLNLIGLTKFRDWYPYKLSGGMQQRVAMARALVVDPKILLMDEPFSALDSQYRKYLRNNLEEIWRTTKKTVIFVTHSVSEALYLADTIYVLTARPASVKNMYRVALPRPRDPLRADFIQIKKEIEKDLSSEFEKIIKNPSVEKSVSEILKVSGRRGVL